MKSRLLSYENVFQVSGDYPEVTFVEQDSSLTRQLVDAIENQQVVVVRGASKSGKTLLVMHALRFVTFPRIWLRGSFIGSRDELGVLLLNRLREMKIEIDGSADWESLANSLKENHVCIIFDDFHYIPTKPLRFEVWRILKALNDVGVSIVVIGVQSPQMRDADETDLTGRIVSVQLKPWTEEQLEHIGHLGFNKLGITALNLGRIVQESLTSPFLMQLLCLLYCQEKLQISTKTAHIERIESTLVEKILPIAASRISYLSTYTLLSNVMTYLRLKRHDGKAGTLGQLILYAVAGQFPIGSMPYFDIHLNRLYARVRECLELEDVDSITLEIFLACIDDMIKIYYTSFEVAMQNELTRHDPAIDLIGQYFYIRDPFLLFYLRHSIEVEQQFG